MGRQRDERRAANTLTGKQLVIFVVTVIVMIPITVNVESFVDLPTSGGLGALTGLLLIPLVVLFAVAAHEFGHLLAGRIIGVSFLQVAVGLIMWLRTDSGGSRVVRLRSQWFSGFVLPDPRTVRTARRQAAVAAGGPAASLCLAVVAILAAKAWGSSAGELLASAGSISAVLGVISLLPVRFGALQTDGLIIFAGIRADREAGRGLDAQIGLFNLLVAGTRPRDWPVNVVDEALGVREDAAAESTRYWRALDAGDIPTARVHLRAALERINTLPRWQHAGMHLEAAYFTALHDGDVDGASQAIAAARRAAGHVFESGVHRAEAAIAIAEGRLGDAQLRIAQAMRALADESVVGAPVERVLLRELGVYVAQRIAGTAPVAVTG